MCCRKKTLSIRPINLLTIFIVLSIVLFAPSMTLAVQSAKAQVEPDRGQKQVGNQHEPQVHLTSRKRQKPDPRLALNKQEIQWLVSHPVIRFTTGDQFPPISFRNRHGELDGVLVDLARLLESKLGITIALEGAPWIEALSKALLHQADGIIGTDLVEERKPYLNFTDPYMRNPVVIVTDKNASDIQSMQDLTGKTVAVKKGTAVYKMLQDTYPDLVIIDARDIEDALNMVAAGKTDAAADWLAVSQYTIENNLLSSLRISYAFYSDQVGNPRIGLRNDDPILLSVFNKAIVSISEKQRRHLIRKWIDITTPQLTWRPAGRILELSQKEQGWLNAHPVLRIGLFDYPPYCFVDSLGNYQGYAFDLIDRISSYLGIRTEFAFYADFVAANTALRNRSIDCLVGLPAISDGDNGYAFTRFYVPIIPGILVRKDEEGICDTADLVGRKVAFVRDSQINELAFKQLPSINPFYVDTILDGLLAVSTGAVDAFIQGTGVCAYMSKQHDITNLKLAVYLKDSIKRSRFTFQKEWSEMAVLFDKALNAIPADEKLALKSKWIPVGGLESDSLFVNLTAEEEKWLQAHPVIKVAAEANWAPIEFVDEKGNFQGIAIDYLHLVEKGLGVRFAIVKVKSRRELVATSGQKRQVDLFFSLAVTPERKKHFLFSQPYLTNAIVIFTRKDVTYIQDLSELSGQKVCVAEGDSIEDWIARDFPAIEVVPAQTIEQGLHKLQKGEVNAFIGDSFTTSFYLGKTGLANIKISGSTPYSNKLAMAVRGDWPILADIIGKSLDAIPLKVRNNIYKQWVTVKYEHGVDMSLIWKILVGSVLVVLLIVTWNVKLSKTVAKRTQDLFKSNEDLRASEEKYRRIVETSQDLIWSVDMQGRWTYLNNAAYRIYGFRSEEMIGRPFTEFTAAHQAQKEMEIFDAVKSGKSVQNYESMYFRKDGSQVFLRFSAIAMYDKQGQVIGATGTAADITELKLAHDKRAQLEGQLRQAQKMDALGTLSGGIAHDFNNILGSILGFAEIMEMFQLGENSSLKESVSHIIKASYRGKDLVQQILTFSKSQEMEKKPVLAVPIVEEALKLIRAAIPASIRIETDIEDILEPIFADPGQIHQIILNLCTNASHAMKAQGGTLRLGLTRWEVDESTASFIDAAPGPYVKLIVSDTGTGIPVEIQDLIFDPYFSTKEKGEGTGLGLSVVHGIVKSHKGAITVESETGKGATFNVFLPLAAAPVTVEAVEKQVAAAHGKGCILFVDDEESLTVVGQTTLTQYGYEVVAETSAEAALDVFHKDTDRFNLIFTDLTMPGMTGIQMATAIKRVRPDLPVILCTGFRTGYSREAIKGAGINEILIKPVSPKDLAKTAERYLANSA